MTLNSMFNCSKFESAFRIRGWIRVEEGKRQHTWCNHCHFPDINTSIVHTLFQNQLSSPNKGRVKKLDQETWLCRTHLDDFFVKIWTIWDHKRTRLNLVKKAILLNLWSIFLDRLGPFGTIEDHLGQYWTFGTIFNPLGPFRTFLDNICPFWTMLDHCR